MTGPTEPIVPRDRAWPGLAAGIAASLLLHAAAGAWLVRAANAEPSPRDGAPAPDMPPPPPETEPPIRLGQIDADRAAITWLGVLEDPAEAEADESEVDQAALDPNAGAEPAPEALPDAATEPITPPTEQPPIEEPIEEPLEESPPEPDTTESESPEVRPSELASQPEPPAADHPEASPDPAPIDPAPADPIATPEQPPPGPSLIAEPRREQPDPTEPSESEPGNTDAVMGPPAPEPTDAPPTPSEQRPSPAPTEPAPTQPTQSSQPEPTQPAEQAKPGVRAVESPRESDASMRERAIEYRSDLNRPLVGQGLEIKTVRPQWPITVRQSYRPGNAHALLRFGADGKVKRVTFIREADGSKGTGIGAVDQPLIDALYRWTAKGPAIDALDPEDPADAVSIPIRILLSRR